MPDIQIGVSVVGATEAASQLQSLGTTVADTGNKAATAGSRFGTFSAALKSQAGSITAVVGSGVMLFNMFDSLADAQNRVNATNVGIERANLRVAKAQDTLNAAIAKYGPNSSQAAQAAQALSIAVGRQEIAMEAGKNASQDMGRAMANVAQNIIPGLVTAVASAAQVISALKGVNISSVFSSVGTAATSAIGGLKAFGVALVAALSSHPILIAATVALAAAFILLRTNAFGVTDRLNELGVAIGKAASPLIPFLNALKEGGRLVGIVGTETEAASKKVAGSAAGIKTMSEAIKQMGQEQATARVEAAQLWSSIIQGASKGEIALKGLDVADLVNKMGEGFKASAGGIKIAQQGVDAFNQTLEKTHNPLDAMQAGTAAVNQTLVGTVEASNDVGGALSRMISTAKWLSVPGVVQGPLGSIMSEKTRSDLHLTEQSLSSIGTAANAIPSGKQITITAANNEKVKKDLQEILDLSSKKSTLPAPDTTVFEAGLRKMTEGSGTVLELGLKDLATIIKTHPPPKPDVSVFQSGMDTISKAVNTAKDAVSSAIDAIGVAFLRLKPAELQSRFGDVRIKFTADTTQATPTIESLKTDVNAVPRDWLTAFLSNPFGLISGATTVKQAVTQVPDNKNTVFTAAVAGAQGSVNVYATSIKTTVPDNKSTAFQALTAPALAQVNPYATTLKTDIPDNKRTSFDALTSPAEAKVNPYKTLIEKVAPATPLTTTINANTQQATQQLNALLQLESRAGIGGSVNVNVKLAEGGFALLSAKLTSKIQAAASGAGGVGAGGAISVNKPPPAPAPISGAASQALYGKGVPSGQTGGPAPVYSTSLRTNVAPPANVGGVSRANAPRSIPVNPTNPYQPSPKAAAGGSFIVSQPTQFGNVIVGEGYRPELVSVIPLGGTSGASILNVIPLKGSNAPKQTGMQHGGRAITTSAMDNWFPGGWSWGSGMSGESKSSGSDKATERINRLLALIEKLISAQAKGLQANINVDGQRMASVTSRYLASRAYGDQ